MAHALRAARFWRAPRAGHTPRGRATDQACGCASSREHQLQAACAAPPAAPARRTHGRSPTLQLGHLRENLEATCNDLSDKAVQLQRLMAHFSGSNKAVAALADSKSGARRCRCRCIRLPPTPLAQSSPHPPGAACVPAQTLCHCSNACTGSETPAMSI